MNAHQKIAQTLAEVWQNKNFDLLKESLADNTKWYEGPYKEPLKNRDAIIDQWRNDLAPQSDIKVETNVLAVKGTTGCYHFVATWSDSQRGKLKIDGIFLVELDNSGKIKSFNQWYALKTGVK